MKLSKSNFVFKAIQELSGFKHGSREVVLCCIESLHQDKGFECDTPDSELADKILEVMRNLG
jgi:hypothetical protein